MHRWWRYEQNRFSGDPYEGKYADWLADNRAFSVYKASVPKLNTAGGPGGYTMSDFAKLDIKRLMYVARRAEATGGAALPPAMGAAGAMRTTPPSQDRHVLPRVLPGWMSVVLAL